MNASTNLLPHNLQSQINIEHAFIRQDQQRCFCLNNSHHVNGGEQKGQPRYFLEDKQTQDLVQVEPTIALLPAPEQHPTTPDVESIRLTPEHFYKALVKIHEQQWRKP